MALSAELDRTRKIGTEFECAVPIIGAGSDRDVQETISHILSRNGIRACYRQYSHEPVPENCDVCVERDSSIQGEQRYEGVRWAQIEVKTRILNGIDDWETVVPKMLEIIAYAGGRITASCGHHLHLSFDEVDADPRHVRSLWNLYHRFNDVVFGLVSPSRRSNQFCRSMPSATKLLHGANSKKELRRRLSAYDRYHGVNVVHLLNDSPRIELRHHQGTLNATKARNWLRLHLAMFRHAVVRSCQAAPAPLPNNRKGIEALLVTTGLKVNTRVYSSIDPALRETGKYVLRTWKKMNGQIPLSKSRTKRLDGDPDNRAAQESDQCAELSV